MALTAYPHTPSTPSSLRLWLTGSPPYFHNISPTSTKICANDFTIPELQIALHYGMREFHSARQELKNVLDGMKERPINKEVAIAFDTLDLASTGPISKIPATHFPRLVYMAKVADDLTLQACLVGLAVGIRTLKNEVGKIKWLGQVRRDVGLDGEKGQGDEDDWFSVAEQGTVAEQEKLYGEIEIQLQC